VARWRLTGPDPSPGVLGAIAIDPEEGAIWIGWDNHLARVDPSSGLVTSYVKPLTLGTPVGVDELQITQSTVNASWVWAGRNSGAGVSQ